MKWLQFDNIETANYYCIADLCPLFEGQKRLSSKLVRSKTPACTLVRFCPKSPFSHFGTREVCPALIYILCLPPLFNHFLPIKIIMVELKGVEPLTSSQPAKRSPS